VLGEVVVAHVVLDGQVGEEDLARHASLHLEAHKRPARYTFVDTLPRTTSGKLQRYLLRRR
jgi:acyl-coenzyme A synthetase/AMP-(fatty) acid ligase